MHVFEHFHKEHFIEGVAKESSYSGHDKRTQQDSGCDKKNPAIVGVVKD